MSKYQKIIDNLFVCGRSLDW